jgi:selenide,water dikinase
MSKKLTDFADCAGCASKLGAAELEALVDDLPGPSNDRILVDYRTSDDAGVYAWHGGPALVQTVDFFTPIVDDPDVFGRIAAANALSDVYAMGGTPRTALAIAALPGADGPDPGVVKAIFRGGLDMLARAGVALLGGHTVTDPEVKFGYAVTGEVHPDRVLRNDGARAGDVVVLTKPLGTGIIVRARKSGQATDEQLQGAVNCMLQLNDGILEALARLPAGSIRACTDVTGFGLAGHASEVAAASGTTLRLESEKLPVLPGVLDLAAEFLPCGGRANMRHFEGMKVSPDVVPERHLVTLDPQTSGGLLLTVSPSAVADLQAALNGCAMTAQPIGQVVPRPDGGPLVHLV